ncbi:hypothetical protein [Delftia tsuruhatensis]|jgi:hypothetical protein|nr:hypothetical protein [Delftia tsuruhatensis]
MSPYAVTQLDALHVRRRLVLSTAAQATVELIYGMLWFLTAASVSGSAW